MSLVSQFAHLPDLPRSDEAEPLLQKIASQVKPIMSKRSWKVGILGEFIPQNPALLGINIDRGQRINLRLRPPGNLSTFYEYDQLVLVMLHELTHIVHSAHDAAFYALLAELEQEYYSLKQKGYSGDGFHSDGHRLNGVRRNEYEGRRRGLEAAERRLNTQRVMGRGGVLGGLSASGLSMREILAEAAERRIRDDKTCNVDGGEALEESRKAQEQSVLSVADTSTLAEGEGVVGLLPRDGSGERARPRRHVNSNGPREQQSRSPPTSSLSGPRAVRPTSTSSSLKPMVGDSSPIPTPSKPTNTLARKVPAEPAPTAILPTLPNIPHATAMPEMSNHPAPSATTAADRSWECGVCTLVNPATEASCEACMTPRSVSLPAITEDGWFCELCGSGPREMEFWSCVECGWVRKWG